MKPVLFADLHCNTGSSDKVYHIAIWNIPSTKFYDVRVAYGRRGSGLALNQPGKTLLLSNAQDLFDKTIKEKFSKGYHHSPGISGAVPWIHGDEGLTAAPPLSVPVSKKESCGFLPPLPKEITETEAESFIRNPDWCMQEKYDGKHMILGDNHEGAWAANKKGEYTVCPPELVSEMRAITSLTVLDGELVGPKFYCYDLLSPTNEHWDYNVRLAKLRAFFREAGINSDLMEVVYTAFSREDKEALYENLKAGGKEGCVFKRLSGELIEDKSDNLLKVKFWHDASFFITRVNEKRSVHVGVWNAPDPRSGQTLMGNVTIPPDQKVPSVGDIVDVRYLYAYKGGSLYQPIYRGKRDDVRSDECTIDRIFFKEE